ncbi:MAG: VanZ family protein [Candidatus Latescibacterota bacterium]|nr:VanZ family protein [Candidatus Latescibacterota bacterium]
MQPNLIKWRVSAVLWMGLIFTLSSSWFAPQFSFDATLDSFGLLNYAVRKCAHAAEFGILTVFLFRSLHPKPFLVGKARLWSALLSLTYAASDEFHQSFVPLRSGKATDLLFDAAGIFAVAFLIRCIYLSDSDERQARFLGTLPDQPEDNRSI